MKPPNPATVVVVEDEPGLRRVAQRVLEQRLGYRLILADRAEDVVERFALGQPFDVIISDYHLPGMDGLALYQLLHARGYRGAFVLTSGDQPEDIPLPEGMVFLPRPWSIDQLTQALLTALGQR